MSDSAVAAELRRALSCGRSGCPCTRSANTHCPSHDDRAPSLTVHSSDDGKLLINCKRGCDQKTVVAAIKDRGLWPETNGHARGRVPLRKPTPLYGPDRPTAIYDYRDAAGKLIAQKCRIDRPDGSKTFKWRLPNAEAWTGLAGLPMSELPLYGADLVTTAPADAPVVYVEGEKACHAARAAGLLAVTNGGGSSTQDFGQALQVLRGHPVLLWPDNDASGRLYMARVHAAVRPLAAAVVVLNPPLLEKGDAYDYFEAGGTVEDLLANAPPSTPVVDVLSPDALRVRYPAVGGVVKFTFGEIERAARSFEAELEVAIEGPGQSREPYTQRVNIMSASARAELRRDLESIYGKDFAWPLALNVAFARVKEAHNRQARSLAFGDIPDPGDQCCLVYPILPLNQDAVIYGTGSSTKTYISLRMGLAAALGGEFLGQRVPQTGVLFLDYEADEYTFKFRLNRLLAGLEIDPEAVADMPFRYKAADGVPLPDLVTDLRHEIEEQGLGFVIVDSAASACGGEPEDAHTALRYFRKLRRLGDVTSLTIAHINAAGETERPFGSIFWRNQPRRTWYAFKPDEDNGQDILHVGLICKKTNDGRLPSPLGLEVAFEGTNGPVTIEPRHAYDIPTLPEKLPNRTRIINAVQQHPLTMKGICDATKLPEAVVKPWLSRLKSQGVFVQLPGNGWGMAARMERNG